MVNKNELCGQYPTLNRSLLNHAKRNVAIACPTQGLDGKYLTITSFFKKSCPNLRSKPSWSLSEILVQIDETVEEYSEVYGKYRDGTFISCY